MARDKGLNVYDDIHETAVTQNLEQTVIYIQFYTISYSFCSSAWPYTIKIGCLLPYYYRALILHLKNVRKVHESMNGLQVQKISDIVSTS